jgi:predicted Zn finger-like uncharacterized protein
MRLICPNCGAQYEVPDDVIPVGGRDVQCSNCGHTWFEQPGASVAAESDDIMQVPPPPAPRPERPALPRPGADLAPEARPAAAAIPVNDPEQVIAGVAAQLRNAPPGPDPVAPAPAAAAPSRRRAIDPAVAEILREEAAREGARAKPAGDVLESQPDLGITMPVDQQRAEESRRRLARMRGESAPAIAATIADIAARRELLPDIEEINSTLRAASGPAADTAPDLAADGRRGRGFRTGFGVMILVMAALGGVYLMAPAIMAQLPQAEPVLTDYVDMVDRLRLWLDLQMQDLIRRIGSATA